MNCEGCKYLHCIRGQQRGVMDCDPDELVCELNHDDAFENNEGCSSYKEYVEYTYDDYLEDHWDERNDR